MLYIPWWLLGRGDIWGSGTEAAYQKSSKNIEKWRIIGALAEALCIIEGLVGVELIFEFLKGENFEESTIIN